MEYANTIAKQLNIELPPTATSSAKACSEFIDANQGLMGGGSYGGNYGAPTGRTGKEPSEKQILYAASLARQRNLGLSAEVLQDRGAMSEFIDGCLSGPPPQSVPAAGTAASAMAAVAASEMAGPTGTRR